MKAVKVIGALAVMVGATGCNTPQQEAVPVSAPPKTTTPAPAPVVTSLDGLLLTPDQINAAMGATAMAVSATPTTMTDQSANDSNPACRTLQAIPVKWTAFREQQLQDPGTISDVVGGRVVVAQYDHSADQAVVLDPSASQANESQKSAAATWPGCANQSYSFRVAGYPDQEWSVGSVANTGSVLSIRETEVGNAIWQWETCQIAATVANNVEISAEACSHAKSDSQSNAAVNIAQQIAAKVVPA
jgi:hypothetical protein